MEIKHYSKEWEKELRKYLQKTFPFYSGKYIDYCLDNAVEEDGEGTSYIILKENSVVGCHMYYNTLAKINGLVVKTRWGHDTFINEDCRKDISIQFIITINRVPAFGIGVTDANRKIQESIRTRFIDGLYTFFCPNFYILFGQLGAKRRISTFEAPKMASKGLFKLINSLDDVNIMNDGFWYSESCNVDFVRDRSFLEKRFLNNEAFRYYIYTCNNSQKCYFVVRPIIFHAFPVLLLVDFRYDENNPQIIKGILGACKSIARKNKLGGVVTISNDINVHSFYSRTISLKRQTTLVANKFIKINGEIKTNVTAADADVDYMYNK